MYFFGKKMLLKSTMIYSLSYQRAPDVHTVHSMFTLCPRAPTVH